MAVDSQDRVIVAGYTSGSGTGLDFAVARLDAFGRWTRASTVTASRPSTSVARTSEHTAWRWTARIGSSLPGTPPSPAPDSTSLWRGLDAFGALDQGFDGDGKQTVDFGGTNDFAHAVAVDNQDRVIVAGYSFQFATIGLDFAVARLGDDGSRDVSFADNGTQTVDFGGTDDYAWGVDVTPGRILLAGYSTPEPLYNYRDNIAIAVLQDNSPPSIDDQGFSLAEGSLAGTEVGTVTASDTDGDPLSYTITGGNEDGVFAIDATTGTITVVDPAAPDFETTTGFALTVEVADGNGGTDSAIVSIEVTNVAPSMPIDGDGNADAVTENAANGTVVGITASSTDPNGPAVTYSLLDSAGGRFRIDPANGIVTVADGSLLDYESATSHTITVEASDGAGGTSTQTFTIDLIDQTATISGTVFVDVDGDGLFDGGTESAIDAVLIELYDDAGNLLDFTSTGAGGVYAFVVGDEFATYRLLETQPTGVADGAAILGSAGGTILSANEMRLTLTGSDASDYDFTEVGQALGTGETAGIGFWQNKHGQALIREGGEALVSWLNENFGNIFGDVFTDGEGGDDAAEVARFYKEEFFKKKFQGTPKVDAQFMATALSAFFTSGQLSGGPWRPTTGSTSRRRASVRGWSMSAMPAPPLAWPTAPT